MENIFKKLEDNSLSPDLCDSVLKYNKAMHSKKANEDQKELEKLCQQGIDRTREEALVVVCLFTMWESPGSYCLKLSFDNQGVLILGIKKWVTFIRKVKKRNVSNTLQEYI